MVCSWRLFLSIHLTLALGLHLRYLAGTRADLEAAIERMQHKRPHIVSAPQGKPSRLAEALVEASAMGLVSPALVQHFAQCELSDHPQSHSEMVYLASMGASGQYPGNVRRDLYNRYEKTLTFQNQ